MSNSLDNTVGKLTQIIPGSEDSELAALLKSQNPPSAALNRLANSFGTVDSLSEVTGTIKSLTQQNSRQFAPEESNTDNFSTASNPQNGFKDKTSEWPTTYRELESDWHRFTGRIPDKLTHQIIKNCQASIKISPQETYDETHAQTREESRAKNIITAKGSVWEETTSDKKTEYGKTWVRASPGGVTEEIDSTLGSQAWRITHPSNSYMEVDGKGNFTQKTYAERVDIIAMGHKTFCNSARTTTIQSTDDLMVFGPTTIKRMISKDELIVGKNNQKVMGTNDRYVLDQDSHKIIAGQTNWIGKEQTNTIGTGQTTTVVKGNQANNIPSGNQINTIKGNQIHTIDGNQMSTLTGNRIDSIEGNEMLTIAGSQMNTIDGDQITTVPMQFNMIDTQINQSEARITTETMETISCGGVYSLDAGNIIMTAGVIMLN